MEQKTFTPISDSEEISLKEIILNIRKWFKYFLSKWKIIIIFGVVGAALGFIYASTKKLQYSAQLTFIVEDSKSSSMGAYAGIASQFGIDLGSSSGSGIFAGENILEFLRSRLMVEKTLLSPVKMNGREISLADHYLNVNDLREGWETKPALKNIKFPVYPDRSKFSLQQDSILNTIYNTIVKYNLSIAKLDKKLSFISVKCTSRDELFSQVFTERLVKEATDFYVETKIKRSKTNVDKLQIKADSLESLLNRKTYSVAATQDLNLNPARNVAAVGTEVATRDKMVLQTMYAEVVKNLELSRMSMSQETPIIQIVDRPILPLDKKKFGRLKGLILGGILGGFIILFWLAIRKLYKDIMN